MIINLCFHQPFFETLFFSKYMFPSTYSFYLVFVLTKILINSIRFEHTFRVCTYLCIYLIYLCVTLIVEASK